MQVNKSWVNITHYALHNQKYPVFQCSPMWILDITGEVGLFILEKWIETQPGLEPDAGLSPDGSLFLSQTRGAP